MDAGYKRGRIQQLSASAGFAHRPSTHTGPESLTLPRPRTAPWFAPGPVYGHASWAPNVVYQLSSLIAGYQAASLPSLIEINLLYALNNLIGNNVLASTLSLAANC